MVAIKMEDGYDPTKSKVSGDTMERFRLGIVTGNLAEVPGLGPVAIKKLGTDVEPLDMVTTTHQLVAKYLSLKGTDEEGNPVGVGEVNQKFWYWLKGKGITSHRSAIVLAINTKVMSFFPEFNDPNDNASTDDDDYA